MRMMVVALLVFLLAIGLATFIEAAYDIQTAKICIYNATWFEILLGYLSIGLIANIFRYRMFQRQKVAMLAFHLAFIIIIIGAAITRFVGFEGLMLIREGQASNFIYSSDPHVYMKINDGKMQWTYNEKHFMSEDAGCYFSETVEFPGHKSPVTIEFVDFQKKMIDSLVRDNRYPEDVLDIVSGGMSSNYLVQDSFIILGNEADPLNAVSLSFQHESPVPGVEIWKNDGRLGVWTKLPMRALPMAQMRKYRQAGINPPDSVFQIIPTDTLVPFEAGILYNVGNQQFVFREHIRHARLLKMPSGKKDVGVDLLTLRITDGNQEKLVTLEGGKDMIPTEKVFAFAGLDYEMAYGSTRIDLPFSIFCKDFQLDRYPGSQTPSSFASDVRIIDKERNYESDRHIFMNHVTDYRGYRFFQSSYDPDEKGTRLSVNYDWWGTNVTYVGYLLMAIGMILSLFSRSGRFMELSGKLSKIAKRKAELSAFVLALFFTPALTQAQEINADPNVHQHDDPHLEHEHDHMSPAETEAQAQMPEEFTGEPTIISREHAEELSYLLVQDYSGRIVPFSTLALEVLNKLHAKSTYDGYNAVQVVMSMHMFPEQWFNQKLIYVSPKVGDSLGLGEYVSFTEISDEQGNFRWMDAYEKAHRTQESHRNEFQKKLIKLTDDYQVMYNVFTWFYMKVVPVSDDVTNTWSTPMNMQLKDKDSMVVRSAVEYLNALAEGMESGSYGNAGDKLELFKKVQRKAAGSIAPSEGQVNLEVTYNRMNFFSNAMYLFLTLGFLMLFLWFTRIFLHVSDATERFFKTVSRIFVVLMLIVFVYLGAGLAMRSYISGHAPWSDGYEALTFIAWVVILAGFAFSSKNRVILAVAAILAFFMLFVSTLSLLDPQISPLQPVLKSYWLQIHVSIITGSYAFLGLAFILGLLNLLLYATRNANNGERLTLQINELTYVSEMTMTIGLFMLTIGTFLGGVWANESWGRYWGWDPKETWALVSVLVYACILHLRLIPGLKGKFLFNAVSFWGFSAILFTFFGVNFILVGLHSYAQGDGIGHFPTWLLFTILFFALFTAYAAIKNAKYRKFIQNQ